MTAAAPRSLPIFAFLSPLIGLATGYGASQLEARFAPVGLFPLLVGAATGIGVIACMRVAGCGSRRGTTAAAVAAAMFAVGVMHSQSYHAAVAHSHAEWDTFQKVQQAAGNAKLNNIPSPINGPRDFVERQLRNGRLLGSRPVRGVGLVVWWTVDALLVTVGAAAAAFYLSTPPTSVEPPESEFNKGPPA
jgi:hypothetical protein